MSVVLITPHMMMKSTFLGCSTTLGKALAILKSFVSRMPNSTSRFVASRTTSTPPAAPPTSSSRRTTSRTRPSEKWQGAIFNHILGKARSSCGCLSWIKPMTPFFKFLKPYSCSGYIGPFFSECANTEQLGRQVLRKSISFFLFSLGSIFPAARFEPGTAGCEARMLPLCYAVPPHSRDI